jgi:hypothetical protein
MYLYSRNIFVYVILPFYPAGRNIASYASDTCNYFYFSFAHLVALCLLLDVYSYIDEISFHVQIHSKNSQ